MKRRHVLVLTPGELEIIHQALDVLTMAGPGGDVDDSGVRVADRAKTKINAARQWPIDLIDLEAYDRAAGQMLDGGVDWDDYMKGQGYKGDPYRARRALGGAS